MSGSSTGAPAPDQDAHEQDLVTVALAARSEQASIEALLDSVRSQTHERLQILVVDGMSTDATAEIVARVAAVDPQVRPVQNPARVIPAAMTSPSSRPNGGGSCASTPAAASPTTTWCASWPTCAPASGAGWVAARTGVATPPRAARSRRSWGRRSPRQLGVPLRARAQPVDHIPFGAYPTALVRELGLWSPTQLVNGDFEFDHRVRSAGHELLFDPEIHIDWAAASRSPRCSASTAATGQARCRPWSSTRSRSAPPSGGARPGAGSRRALRRTGRRRDRPDCRRARGSRRSQVGRPGVRCTAPGVGARLLGGGARHGSGPGWGA